MGEILHPEEEEILPEIPQDKCSTLPVKAVIVTLPKRHNNPEIEQILLSKLYLKLIILCH